MKHGSLQLDSQGRLRHFLSIQGLNRQLLKSQRLKRQRPRKRQHLRAKQKPLKQQRKQLNLRYQKKLSLIAFKLQSVFGRTDLSIL